MRDAFDKVKEGGCIAKKGKKKVTAVYVKRAIEQYRDWVVDILEITDNGISLFENQPFSPSYSDGYRICDAETYLRLRKVAQLLMVSVRPMREKLEESMQK